MVVSKRPHNRLKLLTFNVNGLDRILRERACTLERLLKQLDADVICFQELKLGREDMQKLKDIGCAKGWSSYFCLSSYLAGQFFGVATFCKDSSVTPVAAEEGITGTVGAQSTRMHSVEQIHYNANDSFWDEYTKEELEKLDSHGRCLILDLGCAVCFNLYCPALLDWSKEKRHAYKASFFKVLRHRIMSCVAERPVIVLGDLNINPASLRAVNFEKAAPRHFHPEADGACTVWDGQGVLCARPDYILAGGPAPLPHKATSQGGMPGAWFESCFVSTDIWADCDGSDHQPMRAELVLPGPLPRGGAPPPPELRNNLILAGSKHERASCKGTGRSHPRKKHRTHGHEETPEREDGLDGL